jgi:hypothetical protein
VLSKIASSTLHWVGFWRLGGTRELDLPVLMSPIAEHYEIEQSSLLHAFSLPNVTIVVAITCLLQDLDQGNKDNCVNQ